MKRGYVEINMGAVDSVSELKGGNVGTVGAGDGLLTNGLLENPDAVVLLDEFDKVAEKKGDIIQVFLGAFEGRLEDTKHRRVQCNNSIWVLTANQCIDMLTATKAKELAEKTVDSREVNELLNEVENEICTKLPKIFTPPIVSRIGRNYICFFELNEVEKQTMAISFLQRFADELLSLPNPIYLFWDFQVVKHIARYYGQGGVRSNPATNQVYLVIAETRVSQEKLKHNHAYLWERKEKLLVFWFSESIPEDVIEAARVSQKSDAPSSNVTPESQYFQNCGIKEKQSKLYGSIAKSHNLVPEQLPYLTREYLMDMGITKVGDQMKILHKDSKTSITDHLLGIAIGFCIIAYIVWRVLANLGLFKYE